MFRSLLSTLYPLLSTLHPLRSTILLGLTLLSLTCYNSQVTSHKSQDLRLKTKDLRPNLVKHPDQLTFKPLEVKIPKPDRIVLENGMIVYLLEDHELPLIDVIVRIKTGSVYDPKDKSGLANLTATLMRTGGTASMSAEELDETLEDMAASLEVKVDYEEISLSLSLLAQDLERGLEILCEVLRQPRFDQSKLKLEIARIREQLRREKDQPHRIAMREFRKLVYLHHPYGQNVRGNPEPFLVQGDVKSITRDDVVQFHQTYFAPNNIYLGLAGDFRTQKTLEVIKCIFGNWPEQKIDFPLLPRLERRYQKSVNLFQKEINQASLILGHIGVQRTHPDYFPLMLMNGILGSSSVSRLYHQVRESKGLAYSIYSYFIMPQDLGMFVVDLSTKNESVARAISIILKELKKIQQKPVRDEELQNTKEAVVNQFVFKFDDPRRIIDQVIYLEFLGLPQDYLETYRDKVMQVTKKDIQRVAREYLKPDKLIYVVVGDQRHFDRPLSEFGPVRKVKKQ